MHGVCDDKTFHTCLLNALLLFTLDVQCILTECDFILQPVSQSKQPGSAHQRSNSVKLSFPGLILVQILC